VAAIIVTARTEGRPAVGGLLASLAARRVPSRWYLFVLLLPPLTTAASLLAVDRGLGPLRHFDLGAALANLPIAYGLALPFGPLGEELGWRGFALPRLLSRWRPWAATLILGALWTFWHGPMMALMPGAAFPSFMPLSATSILIYLIQTTAETAVMTLVFLRTGGSTLLAVLAHLAFNTAEGVVFGGLPPLAGEPVRAVYLVNVCLLGIAGLVSVLVAERGNPSRGRAL
jgi:membrane protease YdiL (CAAX protease family)